MDPVPETTHELLVESARSALGLQREDGSFPPGRAGAYDYPLTPVRTTSSWLFTLTKAYEITGSDIFKTAAVRAIDYLLGDEVRPGDYTFLARNTDKKDKCDGLVGQAAPIHGLCYAGRVLGHQDALTVAKQVFELHPFHENLGLWKRVETDGTRLSFDRTLNHQIIFASSAIPLAERFESVRTTCTEFLTRLVENIALHDDGLPRHYVRPPLKDTLAAVVSNPRNWSLLWNECAVRYYSRSTQRRKKEIGYYPVITAELARLKTAWPDHDIWESEILDRVISFLNSPAYEEVLRGEISFGSVMPRFDYATTLWGFENPSDEKLGRLLATAIENNYAPDSSLLIKNAEDPEFQATAVSDLAHLPDIRLETVNAPQN